MSDKSVRPVEIRCAADLFKLPHGFFRCRTAAGDVSLGFHSPVFGTTWRVRSPFMLGGKLVTVGCPLSELPVVLLRFEKLIEGLFVVGGCVLADTQVANETDAFSWEGEEQTRHIVTRM